MISGRYSLCNTIVIEGQSQRYLNWQWCWIFHFNSLTLNVFIYYLLKHFIHGELNLSFLKDAQNNYHCLYRPLPTPASSDCGSILIHPLNGKRDVIE